MILNTIHAATTPNVISTLLLSREPQDSRAIDPLDRCLTGISTHNMSLRKKQTLNSHHRHPCHDLPTVSQGQLCDFVAQAKSFGVTLTVLFLPHPTSTPSTHPLSSTQSRDLHLLCPPPKCCAPGTTPPLPCFLQGSPQASLCQSPLPILCDPPPPPASFPSEHESSLAVCICVPADVVVSLSPTPSRTERCCTWWPWGPLLRRLFRRTCCEEPS